MAKQQRYGIEILFFLVNILYFSLLNYLHLTGYIIFEIFMAFLFLQVLGVLFALGLYFLHQKLKNIAVKLKFDFITRFLEQPRMEGTYKDNWFQIHFSSRSYGKYWGLPRTYIKLQWREDKKFDKAVLKEYRNTMFKGKEITNVEYVKRAYKTYLLMRVKYYVLSEKTLKQLMDFLLEAAKKAEAKK